MLERLESNGKIGFIDQKGKTVVEPIYDRAEDFTYGLAAVNVGAKQDPFVPAIYSAKRGGKWGYIDTKGRVVVPISLDYAAPFSDGLARVGDEKGTRFIDTQGRTVLNLGVGINCGNFSEGLCPVREVKTRYIDHAGKTVFAVDGYGEEFHEGLAALTVPDPASKESRRSGFINRKGQIAIKPVFAEVRPFSEGLAAVRPEKTTPFYGKGDRWGYIDASGKYVIPLRFNEAVSFAKGIARVHEGGKLYTNGEHAPPEWDGGQWMSIDKTGKDASAPFRADAEKAKAALLRLLRIDRKSFIGNLDPDRLEKIALKIYDLREPQKFSWGAFVIDAKRRTYHVDVFTEGLKGAWFYSGTFGIEASGRWTAGKPNVIEAHGIHRHP